LQSASSLVKHNLFAKKPLVLAPNFREQPELHDLVRQNGDTRQQD
jgi:hypothetical protein